MSIVNNKRVENIIETIYNLINTNELKVDEWATYSKEEQLELAKKHCGSYNIHLFILIMNEVISKQSKQDVIDTVNRKLGEGDLSLLLYRILGIPLTEAIDVIKLLSKNKTNEEILKFIDNINEIQNNTRLTLR